MAEIKITELRPAGSELFQDDKESFLNELNDQEMSTAIGGGGVTAASLSLGASGKSVITAATEGSLGLSASAVSG